MDKVDSGKQSYIETKINKLESEILKYSQTLKTYNRLDKAVSIPLATCSLTNIIYTAGAHGTAAIKIGAVACIHLGSLALINSVVIVALTLLS